jgi:tRNA(His) 5'-end guanylyltransferase
MEHKDLGSWCKWLEKNFSNEIMIPELPVIIRLDGNAFHNYTKGLKRPFDEGLTKLMVETTKHLVKETNAIVGYTQSDEISLILYSDNRHVQIYQDGKKQKILSKLTGKCVNFFNEERKKYLPSHNKTANFDCRVFQTPTLNDACAMLLWRENDATKNSILSVAQSIFSHKSIQNLNTSELQDKMMLEKGFNWNNMESKYKRGTYVKRIKVTKPFNEFEDGLLLNPKHKAFKNPDLVIERNVITEIEYPKMNSIQNKVDVIFYNKEPITDKF